MELRLPGKRYATVGLLGSRGIASAGRIRDVRRHAERAVKQLPNGALRERIARTRETGLTRCEVRPVRALPVAVHVRGPDRVDITYRRVRRRHVLGAGEHGEGHDNRGCAPVGRR
jgi:hypothetical protein